MLPRPLDALARAWAAADGRARAVVRLVTVVVLLLAATGGLVRGPWGPPVQVLVTTRPLPAGAEVTPEDLEVTRRPGGLVPPDAVTEVAAVADGTRTAGPVAAGTVLATALLAPSWPGDLAGTGTAVVAVDATLLPPLPVGTRLDVAVPAFDGSTVVAARDAVVVGDDGTWRWLRVGREDVAAIAGGVSDGRLVAAVLGDEATE